MCYTNNISQTKQIAVLLPCYNEAITIGKVIDDFNIALKDYVDQLKSQNIEATYTIYVYDNNSSDDTVKIAKEHGATVKFESRQGKGNVILSMFRQIDADIYIMADGDDTNCPFGDGESTVNIGKMVDEVLFNDVDMCVGKRNEYFSETGDKKRLNGMGNKLVTNLIRKFFKTDIEDILTGFRVFSKRFIKTFPVVSSGFEIETELTIHTAFHNLKWKELPTTYRERPEGSESKLNAISDGLKVLWLIGRLIREYRPLGFFTLTGALFALIGLIMIITPINDYLTTGMVEHFPTLMMSILFFVAALIIAQAGLIMHLIVKKNRQIFAYHYYSVK